MIKTIKVKEQLRLDELIKHIFDNGVKDKSFFTPPKSGMIYPYTEVRVNGFGNIELTGHIGKKDTFTVEVEKEITEEKSIKADEYEANLNEVKRQLKIKIRHARRDGDYSEAYAFSEALDMIENLI